MEPRSGVPFTRRSGRGNKNSKPCSFNEIYGFMSLPIKLRLNASCIANVYIKKDRQKEDHSILCIHSSSRKTLSLFKKTLN